MKKVIVFVLAVLMCLPAFAGCSDNPPELDSVKNELIELLEASYSVNEMLFGAGLVTEYDLSGLNTEYTNELINRESWCTEQQLFEEFYSTVLPSYLKDTDGDGVADTEVLQPTSIAEIKAMAEKVYSKDFLEKTYQTFFVGTTVSVGGSSSSVSARYKEGTLGESTIGENNEEIPAATVLRKYIFIDANNMNYIDSHGGRTVFDYDTMKIVKPSSSKYLNVEISAFYQDYTSETQSGSYDDWQSVPSGYSWHTMSLCFICQDNGNGGFEWRLDAITC